MNLNSYLKHIQQDESIFPIDSFPTIKKKKKKKDVLKVVYPEQKIVENVSLNKLGFKWDRELY